MSQQSGPEDNVAVAVFELTARTLGRSRYCSSTSHGFSLKSGRLRALFATLGSHAQRHIPDSSIDLKLGSRSVLSQH